MNTKSIYLNNDYSKVKTPSDWIGAYGAELATVDTLLVMGYKYSNHVRLADRQKDLIEEIARQEELRKHERGGFFVPMFA